MKKIGLQITSSVCVCVCVCVHFCHYVSTNFDSDVQKQTKCKVKSLTFGIHFQCTLLILPTMNYCLLDSLEAEIMSFLIQKRGKNIIQKLEVV